MRGFGRGGVCGVVLGTSVVWLQDLSGSRDSNQPPVPLGKALEATAPGRAHIRVPISIGRKVPLWTREFPQIGFQVTNSCLACEECGEVLVTDFQPFSYSGKQTQNLPPMTEVQPFFLAKIDRKLTQKIQDIPHWDC